MPMGFLSEEFNGNVDDIDDLKNIFKLWCQHKIRVLTNAMVLVLVTNILFFFDKGVCVIPHYKVFEKKNDIFIFLLNLMEKCHLIQSKQKVWVRIWSLVYRQPS